MYFDGLNFDDRIVRKQVRNVNRGKLDIMMDEDSETPAAIIRRTITPKKSVIAETRGSGGMPEFGFLQARNDDAIVAKLDIEFEPRGVYGVAVEL